jgi:phospholipid N-methyltransferase
MKSQISEYSTFFREFRNTFDTTGALAPSGRMLARAIARPLRNHSEPIRVLEVGAGTGAVTQELVRHIAPGDRLDIVELNDRFVEVLRRRFENEPNFRAVADRAGIFHVAIQDLQVDEPYDHIICGVPFNNFSTELVKTIFRRMLDLLRPGGTLSFFEYLWIRRMKMLVATPDERRRVARVGCVLQRYIDRYERKQHRVFLNVPPAVAHHLNYGANGKNGKNGKHGNGT